MMSSGRLPLPFHTLVPAQAHRDSCLQLGVVASPETGYPSQEVMAVVKRQCRDKSNVITVCYTNTRQTEFDIRKN